MNQKILKAQDLDGYLNDQDKQSLQSMQDLYDNAISLFHRLENENKVGGRDSAEKELIQVYTDMGNLMSELTAREPGISVYPFETPSQNHGEVSRLIAKLRSIHTPRQEFVYYVQRAYELLFNLAFVGRNPEKRNYIITKTPVGIPVQNYAVHKIPDVDEDISNSVMCVMLRGALLPSLIMSKEIQEYSSAGYKTPFALFRIKRDDSKKESNMEYILNLEKSYFDLEQLDGKDLFFADPMNATGGSLVTIINYLLDSGVKPRSIRFFNVISALKGSLRIVRALENVHVYTLWMDPVLNELAYILPGLGDAGDRLNGEDEEEHPRNIIQLIADYGSNISGLYRSQISEIEKTVLG